MENKKKSTALWIITGIIIAAAALVCLLVLPKLGVAGSKDASGESITVELSVTTDGSDVLFDKEVTASEGESLIQIAEKNITDNGGVVYSNGDYGAYITSICGQSEDPADSRYWVFTVNGETPMVGASDYYPGDGDNIVFDLSELHW